MTVYVIDPLRDRRWNNLVDRHPHASVFHTTAWLSALRQTYGYRPMAVTTSAPDHDLADAVPLCEVRSWLTGRRLVSVPFADHCDPMVEHTETWSAIAAHLDRLRRSDGWKYVELRPRSLGDTPLASESAYYWLHALDLRSPLETLFAALHKDSTKRKIQRANREGLSCVEGRSERLLRTFYELLVKTRHRHHVPPQPLQWFQNLADSFGDALRVAVAFHGTRPVASVLTLRHRDTTVYKYGASDDRYHPLGGMHLLLWKTIEMARGAGCTVLDLGRCDRDNPGLATFKERWGASRSDIRYRRFGPTARPAGKLRTVAAQGARQVLDHAPVACRVAAGRFLYRHAG